MISNKIDDIKNITTKVNNDKIKNEGDIKKISANKIGNVEKVNYKVVDGKYNGSRITTLYSNNGKRISSSFHLGQNVDEYA